ncbi:MAG: type II toxin-antitoxin system HigB family toxin [Deinococcales bacterium]
MAKVSDSQHSLMRWFQVVSRQSFTSFAELRAVFPNADQVNDLTIFNIAGNKYRLIASIHFNRGKIYIRHILTHAEYDRERWKI